MPAPSSLGARGRVRGEKDTRGNPELTDPWGRELADAPELKAAGESAAQLQKQRGLAIDDQTCRPDWDGGPLDTYALDVIIGGHQELETKARAGGDG